MISSEVQRTLVKSPPELWSELSDPASLSRHLGEFGEIRITRVEPEKAVEWEADNATGTVLIKPSGWGTRVTLTASRDLAAPSQQEPEAGPEAAQEPEPRAEPMQEAEPQAEPMQEAEPQAEPMQEPEPQAEPVETESWGEAQTPKQDAWDYEPEPEPQAEQEPEPRRSFLARLFGRRRGRAPIEPLPSATIEDFDEDLEPYDAIEDREDRDEWTPRDPAAEADSRWPQDVAPQDDVAPPEDVAAVADVAPPEDVALAGDVGPAGDSVGPAGDTALPAQDSIEPAGDTALPAQDSIEPAEDRVGQAEPPAQVEEAAAEEVTAVLTTMLDRLGTAHHRPFSRA